MSQEPSARAATPAHSQSLYRKYRPNSFDPDELVGQEHIARTLQNAIVLDRVAHAYLFCGPRGTGKTTMARLLAKAVNCEHPDPLQRPCNACPACLAINAGATVDIIEIDAASNRGVDDIRDLREKVKYAPTQLRVKFYIIDEAHQLTKDAFNAFLKTLEEPPPHVKFVLATTEADKLLDTVASRCQRFDFRRIPLPDAIRRLRTICAAEGLDVEAEALEIIARQATGSLRDALGLLEQLALYCESPDGRREISADAVRRIVGLSRNERLVGLVDALARKDAGEGLRTIGEAAEAGEDVHQLNRQLVAYLRTLMLLRAGGHDREADDEARRQAEQFSLGELADLVRTFSAIEGALNKGSFAQLPLEIAFVDAVVGPRAVAEVPSASPVVDRTPPVSQPRAVPRTTSPRPAASQPEPPLPEPRQLRPAAATPAPVRPVRAEPLATGPAMQTLISSWSQIRREVRVANSRIAALLSSVDPVAVQGDQVVLVSAYEFHRNKLSDDAARRVIEDVIGRHIGGSYRVTCVAPGEAPAADAPPAATPAPSPGNGKLNEAPVSFEPEPEPEPEPDPEEDARLRAARTIFDAEEIEPE